ncbi:MAG TPA: helix-turn-helix domain-containing protein [Vicinamibacterales bacterium]|jgi:transcriptional regulator with XRE-family HTH domain|nr:helix-turn-helix domain-containing protein [Vicinamibacterales bacterium]
MPDSFGARLRQRREQQTIALATIAEQTKIKLSLLERLERDDVSHWPSGIFRRAFIRAYAHAIGLEPDVIVREFLELYPDPAEVVATDPSLRPDVERVQDGAGPPSRFRYLVSSAIGSLAGRRPAVAHERSAAVVERPMPAVEHVPIVERPMPAVEPAPIIERPPITPIRPLIAENPPIAACASAAASDPPAPDFEAAADLCTELGRAVHTRDVAPLLENAAKILDAVGVIVWAWDAQATALRPAVAHGYSDKVLAQLPAVRRDAANATAAAFRTAQPCTVAGSERTSSALVAPLITSSGCVGVLAIELPHGREQTALVRAAATIFAALLARWIAAAQLAEISDRRLA